MKHSAKLAALLTAAALTATLAGCTSSGTADQPDNGDTGSDNNSETYVVGICQQMTHDALDAATQGFKDALTEKLGDAVTFEEQDAGGEYANCGTIMDGFVSQGVDLILANATYPLQAAAAATGDIPILGTSVNAYAASAFYAVDRYASWKKVWGEDYRKGGLILSDRYTSSNAVHQACKLPEDQWEDFFRWLDDFEHDKLGLPRADLVLYLDMPTELAVSLLRSREAQSHTKGDIHEVDTDYLSLCHRTARKAAACLGWTTISCVDGSGALRSPEEIHREIWRTVQPYISPAKG